MARKSITEISHGMLSRMIHYRSGGETIAQTAFRLGLAPWNVSYLTRFIKVCVGNDEYQFLLEKAAKHKFGTVGEFVMDVFNNCYDEFYVPMKESAKKRMKKAKPRKIGGKKTRRAA